MGGWLAPCYSYPIIFKERARSGLNRKNLPKVILCVSCAGTLSLYCSDVTTVYRKSSSFHTVCDRGLSPGFRNIPKKINIWSVSTEEYL